MDDFPTVCYRSGKVHAVFAAGSAEDGSLWGMVTLCGRRIDDLNAWEELEEARLTCQRCIHAFRPEDRDMLARLLHRSSAE